MRSWGREEGKARQLVTNQLNASREDDNEVSREELVNAFGKVTEADLEAAFAQASQQRTKYWNWRQWDAQKPEDREVAKDRAAADAAAY